MCDVLWRVVMSCMSWACVQRAAGHESSGLEKDGLTFHRRVILFYHRLCHNLGPMAAGNRAVRALSHKRACMCSTVGVILELQSARLGCAWQLHTAISGSKPPTLFHSACSPDLLTPSFHLAPCRGSPSPP